MSEALERNQLHTVRIEGCTSEGQGVARIGGRAVFVKGALPGEQCLIRILKAGKTAVYAKVEELQEASAHRVSPDCPHFGKCGGCDFRHVDYEEECRLKSRRVEDALRRIGGVELPVEEFLAAEEGTRYRAKAIFAVGQNASGRAVTGFYRARSHDIIPVEDCLLQTREANAAAAALRRWMDEFGVPAWQEQRGKGLVKHIFVREGMVCIVARDRLPHAGALVEALKEACPELRSVILNRNRSEGNTVLSGSFETLWGESEVEVGLSGLRFRLSPRSFFQVNPRQAERLYARALDYAGLSGSETLVDLYCGAGSIGLLAASKAREVIGVEVVPEAVEDARMNARRNGAENIRFLCADASEAAQQFAREGVKPDVLIVDPPRKGLDEAVIAAAVEMAPRRLVYVSCDPGTLARDLRRFRELGYEARRVTAVDMFPRTRHVESVVLLCRKPAAAI